MLTSSAASASSEKIMLGSNIIANVNQEVSPLFHVKSADYSYAERRAIMNRILKLSGKANLGRSLDWAREGVKKNIPKARFLYALHARHGIVIDQSYPDMLEQLELAAQENYAPAICELADVYQQGLGVTADKTKALELLHRAAQLGDNDARCKRALLLREMGFDKEATELLVEPAKAGIADALFALGVAYTNGIAIEKNPLKALECFEQASSKGHLAALGALRAMYLHGIGIPASPEKAQELTDKLEAIIVFDTFIQRHDHAFSVACKLAGRIVRSDKEGRSVLKQKAQEGSAEAHLALGNAYLSGYGGDRNDYKAIEHYLLTDKAGDPHGGFLAGVHLMHSDPERAEPLLRSAIEKGSAYAPGTLARAYLFAPHNPFSFAQDERKAYELYRQAASRGNGSAQFMLGIMLYNGMSCQQDRREAREWFAKAAAQNHPHAHTCLAKYERFDPLKEGGYSREEREARAFEYYAKAAELGDDHAQYQMAFKAFTQNKIDKGVYWLELAAELGNEAAMEELANCYMQGRGVAKDFAKAVRMYEPLALLGRQAACLKLADIYEKGKGGVARDAKKAFHCYKRAYRPHLPGARQIVDLYLCSELDELQNPHKAYHMLEDLLDSFKSDNYDQYLQLQQLLKFGNDDFSIIWGRELKACEHRARSGDAKAQHQLAVYHLRGEYNSKDVKKAFEYLKQAEKGGSAEVLLDLALYYHKGIAAPADHAKAIEYYEKAIAAQPDGKMYLFASLFAKQNEHYRHGMTQGKQYLQIACEKGEPDAIFFKYIKPDAFLLREPEALRALCALADTGHFPAEFVMMNTLTGHAAPKDKETAERALTYTFALAERGYAAAQFKLGVYYQEGVASVGLAPNREKAIKWFSYAARGGHKWAQNRLRKLQSE